MNHPLTVDAQIDHGLNVAGYGAWGFSPSNIPEGGYCGLRRRRGRAWTPNGMPSNEDGTLVDRGFAGLPGPARRSPTRRQSAYTNGVVTPHAAFLGAALPARTRRSRTSRGSRDPRRLHAAGASHDAVNVGTG